MKTKAISLSIVSFVLMTLTLTNGSAVADDSCYKDAVFLPCLSPGEPGPVKPTGWECTQPEVEQMLVSYEPDPTNKGFYVKNRGCRSYIICTKPGQRAQTVYGEEGTNCQDFQDGACVNG